MKKTIVFLLSAVFMFTVFSCGSDKPVENLNDLKEKYSDKEFKNCDEFIMAYEEAMDVYFKTITRAVEGDEDAKKDVDAFEEFLANWEKDVMKFEAECPEKFEKFNNEFEENMEANLDNLMKLYMPEGDFGDEWGDEMSNEEFNEMLEGMSEEDFSELEAELQN